MKRKCEGFDGEYQKDLGRQRDTKIHKSHTFSATTRYAKASEQLPA